ncbi:MAG: hypothetical protein Ct9H300mP9_5330 [Candidatus Neomarinimicrobiota bacterium]|nr:MAG: hypothetical protein Ct9H300mP9_5330 [Candidatus Neomarinimicrobiota bacterium]
MMETVALSLPIIKIRNAPYTLVPVQKRNGYIQTFNKYEQPTAYLGSNRDMDGIVVLNDRYGSLAWPRSAKQ